VGIPLGEELESENEKSRGEPGFPVGVVVGEVLRDFSTVLGIEELGFFFDATFEDDEEDFCKGASCGSTIVGCGFGDVIALFGENLSN
jgi:hypothetical protein